MGNCSCNHHHDERICFDEITLILLIIILFLILADEENNLSFRTLLESNGTLAGLLSGNERVEAEAERFENRGGRCGRCCC